MSATDWTIAVNSLTNSSVLHGASAGFPKPPGGGNFVYGFHSIDASPGVVALYCNISGTAPTTKGGSISAAMQRAGASSGKTGFAPFIFFCFNGNDVLTARAYILGLGDADPSHIILRKGVLADGLPDVGPGAQGVLQRSTDAFHFAAYQQLKLEVVVNGNGDAVINCARSDLAAHNVDVPVWTPIAGMPQFIDDNLGVNSGSVPILAGRFGYGYYSAATGRVAYIDQILPTTQV